MFLSMQKREIVIITNSNVEDWLSNGVDDGNQQRSVEYMIIERLDELYSCHWCE